ncbi:unnamed protein product [Urochloa humidicola]
MGLSRRFLNLIVDNRIIPGAKSLRCIDLTRQHFFNSTTPQPQDATSLASTNLKNTQAAAGRGNPEDGEDLSSQPVLQLPSHNFKSEG